MFSIYAKVTGVFTVAGKASRGVGTAFLAVIIMMQRTILTGTVVERALGVVRLLGNAHMDILKTSLIAFMVEVLSIRCREKAGRNVKEKVSREPFWNYLVFDIERQIVKLSVEEKQNKRQELSKPILDEFFDWVSTTLSTKIVVNNKLKKALVYAKNQQKELSEFLNDGRIPISNSLAERSIRPFAVHRKNWLFADTQAGANAKFYYREC